jgi:protein-tyrosine phosphatase
VRTYWIELLRAHFGARDMTTFVDIHCHLLPGIDDGAQSVADSLAMARMAVDDGIRTIICTPHQLGNFGHNCGEDIRRRVLELQTELTKAGLPLQVVAGADVRIEPGMVERLQTGSVLTLGDQCRHVLLELPHELYLPLEPVLAELARAKMVGVLSHPERNEGILRNPNVLPPLVDAGCLMQITAGSLCGTMGPQCREMSEWMLAEGLVHFVATDAHSPKSRRPLLRRAFERVAELTNAEMATVLCHANPISVVEGRTVRAGRHQLIRPKRRWFASRATL